VGDKVRELGLVQHEGQWMRPEERAELLAARRVERFGAGPATVVSRALEGLEIGPPLGFRNLMLYPLIAAGERAVAVTTLPEAVAADRVEITDDVNALQVRVKNKGDADIAVLAGEILLGGRHARVVARDTIVPAKKDRAVEVFDVEPAELRAADKTAFRRESGHYWAPLGMRRLMSDEGGQAAVWGAILANGGRASTADLYREHRPALNEFRTALFGLRAAHPGMVGVAVAIGDSIASAEVFGSPALFAAHFDRILESAAIEAIVNHQRETRFPSDLPAGPLSVKRLAESAFGAELDDEGDSVVLRRNGRILGRVLTSGNDAVRVLLFPDGPAAPRPALDLAVAPAKVQHLLKAYDARLQAPNTPPQRKTAVIREMAMLPGDHARLAVLDKAKPQAPYRRDAIEALGLRGDPAAGEQLLKWLKESRKDVTTYSVLAQALARLGNEDAIHVLIGDLDPKLPVLARAAAEYIPLLMYSMRNPNALETAVGTLITAMNRMPPEPGSDPQGQWTLRTLRLVTGKSFAGTVDYTLWWNDPANRTEFLELRRRARE
jgi:hypothetical protein